MNDATYVLTKLDDKNAKALFRRAHAYKTMNKWEEAARDLTVLYKENQEESVKNEINVCLKKAIESKKVTQKPQPPKEQPKAAPKVEEVKVDPSASKSVKIEEAGSSDSDDDAEALKKMQ